MYETLVFWESAPDLGQLPVVAQEFAEIWKGKDKIVYSRTLSMPSSERTRIEPDFDAEAVKKLKATASSDLTVGGPELAGQAIEAGAGDALPPFFVPPVVRGGEAP